MSVTTRQFRAPSTLSRGGDGTALALALAPAVTPQGLREDVFYAGLAAYPHIAASGLLAVADVAATRFADAGLAKRLANLDPVITASGDRLRWESFSVCNGVYACFDLLPEGLGGAHTSFGTTNVDINPPLRADLSSVGAAELLHLCVGNQGLTMASPGFHHIERPVNLPDRWVRGFAEVPAFARGLTPVLSLDGAAGARFLHRLPAGSPGPSFHLLPAGTGVRESWTAAPGSLHLAGTARLLPARRLARWATQLDGLAGPHGSSGWVLHLPGARLTLLLSPDPYHGFSGEGTLLLHLAALDAARSADRLLAHLAWQPRIDPEDLAATTGMARAQVEAGLAWLAAAGRVGHDVTEDAYFHRELPIDHDAALARNPRLAAARRLLSGGAIQGADGSWRVRGSQAPFYEVTGTGHDLHCTCAWGREHRGARGPCKHVLAVVLTERPTLSAP